jgi:hypothetical protein
MNFAVMSTAQWHRELITHLSSKRSALCKSEVVRIGRTPAANQAGMSCDEFHMLSIADSSRMRRITFSILSVAEVSVLSGLFRSRAVAWLRIDPKGDGGGSVLPAPSSSSANLAGNAFSSCRASATFNEFLAGRMRRAQTAAASTELTSLSSPRSWSHKRSIRFVVRVEPMGDRRAQMRDTGFEVVVATRPRNTRVVEPCARGDHIQCQTECYNWPSGRTLLCGRAQRESHFFAPRSRRPLLELLTSLPLRLAKLFPVAAPSLSSRLKPASSEPFTFKTDRVCGQERFSLNSIRR